MQLNCEDSLVDAGKRESVLENTLHDLVARLLKLLIERALLLAAADDEAANIQNLLNISHPLLLS